MQFVIVSLTGWGLLIFSGYKFLPEAKARRKRSLELLILKNYGIPQKKKNYGNWDWYMVGVRCCNKEN
ncbi:hypothetical protein ABKV19_014015 [Rosa sericea]